MRGADAPALWLFPFKMLLLLSIALPHISQSISQALLSYFKSYVRFVNLSVLDYLPFALLSTSDLGESH